MQQTTQFNLIVSGMPVVVPNSLLNSASLIVNYSLSNLSTAVVNCEGISNSSGDVLLDSYSGGSTSNRSISLGSVTYDSFRFTASWTGGSAQSCVAVSVTSSGNGAAFATNLNLTSVHSQ